MRALAHLVLLLLGCAYGCGGAGAAAPPDRLPPANGGDVDLGPPEVPGTTGNVPDLGSSSRDTRAPRTGVTPAP